LYYNRARYYNPQLARFISRDPIDIADDLNLYSYVGNNSMKYVDLMGTEKVLIINTLPYSINPFKSPERISNWLKDRLIKSWYNWDLISTLYTSEVDTFINSINDFTRNNNNWTIVYIGHNQNWLSEKLTNDKISLLNNVSWWNITIELAACNTVSNSNTITEEYSHIAQKISNQTWLTTYWSTDYVNINPFWIDVTEWSWIEITPK